MILILSHERKPNGSLQKWTYEGWVGTITFHQLSELEEGDGKRRRPIFKTNVQQFLRAAVALFWTLEILPLGLKADTLEKKMYLCS